MLPTFGQSTGCPGWEEVVHILWGTYYEGEPRTRINQAQGAGAVEQAQ